MLPDNKKIAYVVTVQRADDPFRPWVYGPFPTKLDAGQFINKKDAAAVHCTIQEWFSNGHPE